MKGTFAAAFRALRHRNFRIYWVGHMVSSTGTWAQIVAQSWLVYRLSHSAVLLGLVGFASRIPILVLGLLGGVVADRWDRRRLILIAHTTAMIQALAMALLTLSGHIEIWHVFALVIVAGMTNAIDIPARQSFIIEISGREDLMNAIALNSSAFQTARMVGPALAALLLARLDEGACFLVNSLSFLAMIAALLAIGLPRRQRPSRDSQHLTAELKAGLQFAWNKREVRFLLLLVATIGFWGVSYFVLMPIFSAEVLGAGTDGLGILMSASGLGSIAGTLYVARRASRGGMAGMRRLVTGCGAGLGLSLIGFAASDQIWLSALMSAVAGGLMLTLSATANTCIQMLVPDELRGRTMSLYTAMFVGAIPFGHLFAGLVAERAGARAAVTLAGVFSLVTTVAIARKLPQGPALAGEISAEVPGETL